MNACQQGWLQRHNKSYTGYINDDLPNMEYNQRVQLITYKIYCSKHKYNNHKQINTNEDVTMTEWLNKPCTR